MQLWQMQKNDGHLFLQMSTGDKISENAIKRRDRELESLQTDLCDIFQMVWSELDTDRLLVCGIDKYNNEWRLLLIGPYPFHDITNISKNGQTICDSNNNWGPAWSIEGMLRAAMAYDNRLPASEIK